MPLASSLLIGRLHKHNTYPWKLMKLGRPIFAKANRFRRARHAKSADRFLRIPVAFPKPGSAVPLRVVVILRFALLLFVCSNLSTRAQTNSSLPFLSLSSVIEVAGQVEHSRAGTTNWLRSIAGLALRPGDRVRTLAESRAAIQLSDRSVIRLNERTTLEILPPRRAEKRRFGLPRGSLFFFNREKPADIEFDTPLAAGAIRGTEFLLEIGEDSRDLKLALIDGRVTLQNEMSQIALQRGEELRLQSGRPPQIMSLVNVNARIQWALYYPAVLTLEDLNFRPEESQQLRQVIEYYRAGDLLAALDVWPVRSQDFSSDANFLHAALELAVGRVTKAEALLTSQSSKSSAAAALSDLIATVRGNLIDTNRQPRSSSEWLARSYFLQAQFNLTAALEAATKAAALAPQSGFAHARVAELEFSFGRHHRAVAELDRALSLSPRLPSAHALRGFVLLEQGKTLESLSAFRRSRASDAAFAPAWLGSGLCFLRERDFSEARAAFQAAAALEPQRALFRSYLGKAASELGEPSAAEKEFRLAQKLDPNDPTSWLYSALHLWQQNRLNEAIRELEISSALNDQLAPFRSRLLLDADRSVRSANLAVLYDEAGFPDVSRHAAARAVAEDYENFSGHLFLANSYQAIEDINRFDLRLETARQSELLVANLLAPPGAGNLSQQLSQQQHLQFFDPRPLALSSLTEYSSRGDWHHADTLFGTLDGFGYAFDASYESLNGQRPNNDAERQQFFLTLKQRITPDDEFYFQLGQFRSRAGDLAAYFDPSQAKLDFRVTETQEPTLYGGWHHAWSPSSHTLFLVARLDDTLTYHDPQPNLLFLRQTAGVITEVQSPPAGPPFNLDFDSSFTLYSAELQQIWNETDQLALVLGGRWQTGDIDTHATFSRVLTGLVTDQNIGTSLDRGDIYAYQSWQVIKPLRLIAGVSYDHISFPENNDLPPISSKETTRDLLSPKAGLLFAPWEGGLLRACYSRSLGGLFFDNSVRLEPSQIAGFNQAFRSLIPESVAGLVPGTEFETAGIGFDQSFPSGTWFGLEAEWLTSDGSRTVGVLTNSLFLPIPDSPSSTRQALRFRERDLSAYAAQLVGNWFSLSARYRLSEAKLNNSFPQIPDAAANLNILEEGKMATLHQLTLAANVNHPSGFFLRFESNWYYQKNSGYQPALATADFWQHNVLTGYRFPRRYAEITLGLLNLIDKDYRLNPLNLHSELPRGRTFTASVRLNF